MKKDKFDKLKYHREYMNAYREKQKRIIYLQNELNNL